MEKQLAELILPVGILDHFEVVNITQGIDPSDNYPWIKIHLQEFNHPPVEYDSSLVESKGFHEPKQLQDFPIRGKRVYLHIKRRRWRLKSDPNKSIHNDYSHLASGTRMTAELSAFLKGTGRNTR